VSFPEEELLTGGASQRMSFLEDELLGRLASQRRSFPEDGLLGKQASQRIRFPEDELLLGGPRVHARARHVVAETDRRQRDEAEVSE